MDLTEIQRIPNCKHITVLIGFYPQILNRKAVEFLFMHVGSFKGKLCQEREKSTCIHIKKVFKGHTGHNNDIPEEAKLNFPPILGEGGKTE